MCFSPGADLVAGVVVAAIGVDACLHVDRRREYWMIAPLPLLLGVHQVIEAFVWWGIDGRVPRAVGTVAMWAYLLVALVLLPTMVPAMVLRLEPRGRQRSLVAAFVGLGVVVSLVLLGTMLAGHPSVAMGSDHLAYSIGLSHGVFWVGCYVVAICGALIASSMRSVRWFGVANLVAIPILARLCAEGFTSLWCFYAASLSAAVAIHLRITGRAGRRSALEVPGARSPSLG